MTELLEYLYVIIDPNGACWAVLDNDTKRLEGLPALLRDGWRPVRETPFSGVNTTAAYVLILLEREPRKSRMGFEEL